MILPYLPVFFFGSFYHRINDSFEAQFQNSRTELVKGDNNIGNNNNDIGVANADKEMALDETNSKKNKNETLNNCDLSTLGNDSYSFAPTRKKTYYDLKIWAASSVAIDTESGTILHYENGRKRTQVASLTKIMTAILAMEHINNLDEVITIPRQATLVPGTVVGCPTSAYCPGYRMYTGEKIRAIDLMKAMIMNSANDAATALAIHIAGSQEKFVDMMNEKARNLGLKDTNFCTPSGLEIDGKEQECYSTAYDIARIGVESLNYAKIWDIMRIPEDEFSPVDGKLVHQLKNTDLLLQDMPNCLGGKTGFTPMAGKSLLTGSQDRSGKHRIIAVLLNDPKRWEDMRILIDWVYSNYEWK